MKTKTVTLYADLRPAWQDDKDAVVYADSSIWQGDIPPDYIRVRITVDLPEHHLPSHHAVEGKVEK